MTPWRILALPPIEERRLRAMIAPLGDDAELVLPATRDRAGMLDALPRADLVIGDYSDLLVMDAEAVAAASRLAFLQMPQAGVDLCDLVALTAAGVPVANTAGANARAVAEWVVAAALALCRELAWGDRRIRSGGWPQPELMARATELHTKRVGVIGYGAIGAETAGLFSALGCQVAYWSRTRRADAPFPRLELDDLLSGSDIVVPALPLTGETSGLLNVDRLALLQPGAFLINASRGGIVDEKAMVAALDEGRLAAAALDVFAAEPLEPDSPLRSMENVLLSPHVAGATRQAQTDIIAVVTRNLTAAIQGDPVSNVVNNVSPSVRRRT